MKTLHHSHRTVSHHRSTFSLGKKATSYIPRDRELAEINADIDFSAELDSFQIPEFHYESERSEAQELFEDGITDSVRTYSRRSSDWP